MTRSNQETTMTQAPPQRTLPSLFEPYSPGGTYGIFGYAGACCQRAIWHDDPAMAEECWRRGWMDGECQTLMGRTLLQECDLRAPKVAAKLRALGPTRVEPEMTGCASQ